MDMETARNTGTADNSGSDVAKKSTADLKAGISVYPNPVENKKIQVQFVNQAPGQYNIQLVNNAGQQVYSGMVQLTGTQATRSIQLDGSTPAGVYQITVISSDGSKSTQQVLIR